MALFFYGTLMDLDVLGLVIGRPVPASRLQPARLSGWRRARALGQPYPIVLPDRAGSVDGVVVDRLTPADIERLCRYEGDGYDLVPVEVMQDAKRRRVRFFRPRAVLKPDPEPWDFARWLAEEKAGFLARIARYRIA